MKKLRGMMPVILLLLALLILQMPKDGGNDTAGSPQMPQESADVLQLVPQQGETQTETSLPAEENNPGEEFLPEDGSYTTREDVSRYLQLYGHLPPNFVTKKEAEKAGWDGGSLERVLPGKCIGGDYFGNYQGQLPKAKGRTWRECDINTLGKKSRGPERLIFSNDGLIYYTDDHYESFILLCDGRTE